MPVKNSRQWIAGMLALVIGQVAVGDAAVISPLPANDSFSGAGAYVQDASVSSAGTERYEYDALGRLRKVTFANGAVTTYTLDKAGNRTAVVTTTR